MREQHSGRDSQGSASFWIPQWQSDHLPPMNKRATQWKRQAGISIILNSPMTIRPLTCYEWESNTVEETGRDQHHSEFPNDNQTTYKLWMREQHSGRDRQGLASFWIPKWQSDHLLPIYKSNENTHIHQFWIMKWLLTCVCGNHDPIAQSSSFCSFPPSSEVEPCLWATNGSNALSISKSLIITYHITYWNTTHFLIQYSMQSNMLECWVLISNICMDSSFKATAVLSRRTWHSLSDLSISM